VACTSGLVARADRALYAAKAAGRDRIVGADEVAAEDQGVPAT
jgi:PleD family two-component response regulator